MEKTDLERFVLLFKRGSNISGQSGTFPGEHKPWGRGYVIARGFFR